MTEKSITTNEERDALAAKYFPDLWKNAQQPGKSKKRNQLRNAAEDMVKKEALRAQGACCSNCDSFSTIDMGRGKETYCQAHSDFHGYEMTKPQHLCTQWSQKNEQAT